MKKHLPIILLLGCTALLAFGIVQLFELRFETGDAYPPYSSLRADPLGTMAFYDALGKMPGLSVKRDFSMSNRLPSEPQTAYFHLAADRFEWNWMSEDLFQELKRFLAGGGRLVIAYYPQTKVERPDFFDDEEQTNSVKSMPLKAKEEKPVVDKPVKKRKKTTGDKSWRNLEEEWGFHEGFEKIAEDGDNYLPVTVVNQAGPGLPPRLAWHSGMIFTNYDAAWRIVYSRGTNAAIMERQFGKGSVIIASDSYFLSNEAMLTDRHSELLAWLVGANTRIVFDEAHLGILESPGVAALMRKYHLHGLVAGLLLLAGLFVWKNSASLVPPQAEAQPTDFIAGKDAASGFINLLRRSIAPRDLLAICFAEWKKTAAPSGKFTGTRLRQAEAIFQAENTLPPKDRNPIATYHKISEILGNRKPKS